MFCPCNRHVDTLATWTPSDPCFYRQRGRVIVDNGYALATEHQHVRRAIGILLKERSTGVHTL